MLNLKSKTKKFKVKSLKINSLKGNLFKRIKIKSIKTKLILAFTLLILLSSVSLAYISITSASNAILSQTEYSLAQLVIEGSELTEESINNQLKILEKLANKSEMQSKKWDIQRDFIKKERLNTDFVELAVVLLDGTAQLVDGSTLQLSDREYVNKALNGEPNVSDIVISKQSNHPILVFAVPIYNGNMVVSALIGRMHGNTLSDMISDTTYGTGGYSFMVNSEGNIVAHPDENMVMKQYNPVIEAGSDSSISTLAKLIIKMNEEKIGRGSFTNGNDEYLVGFKPVEKTNWIFATTLPKDQILTAIPTLTKNIILVVMVILAISIAITYFIGSLVINPIIKIAELSNQVSDLDMTINLPKSYLKKSDETGDLSRAFKNIIDNLKKTIYQIDDMTNQLTTASESLAETANQSELSIEEMTRTIEGISIGANEQASSTEVGASKIAILSKSMEDNKNYMSQLSNQTKNVSKIVSEGLDDIDKLSNITDQSSIALDKIHHVITKTEEISNSIKEASKLISSIAKQTNLLALNAAIEAARVGDAGRGFAVVAEEIRKLAEQSATSTLTIDKMVQELQVNSKDAVIIMEIVSEISKEQQDGIKKSNKKYISISKEIEIVNNAVEKSIFSVEIMEAMKNEILHTIQGLTAIAEENSASTEQASASMEEQALSIGQLADSGKTLSLLSVSLKDIICRFKI